jgi:hypothetical protein
MELDKFGLDRFIAGCDLRHACMMEPGELKRMLFRKRGSQRAMPATSNETGRVSEDLQEPELGRSLRERKKSFASATSE